MFLMLIAGCFSNSVRIYNTIDIPDNIISPVTISKRPIIVHKDPNIENILYDYKSIYYSLKVCNARIVYINRYIKKYNYSIVGY